MARIRNTIQANGKRKVCRIYDAGDAVIDRYTIALKGHRVQGHGMVYPYIASGIDPRGCSAHGESKEYLTGRHLGQRVSFDTLPEAVQRLILSNI